MVLYSPSTIVWGSADLVYCDFQLLLPISITVLYQLQLMGDWIDSFQKDTAEILAFNKRGNRIVYIPVYPYFIFIYRTVQCYYMCCSGQG